MDTCKDDIRRLVETEGKFARNLVAYSVPANNGDLYYDGEDEGKYVSANNNRKHRNRGSRRKSNSNNSQSEQKALSYDTVHNLNKTGFRKKTNYSINSNSGGGSGVYSPPITKRSGKSGGRVDLRARYWKHLFDSLHRAVDGLYYACECEEDVQECEDVIHILGSCTHDFQTLIERIRVQQAYEKDEMKPSSLAWEVRKIATPSPAPGAISSDFKADMESDSMLEKMSPEMKRINFGDGALLQNGPQRSVSSEGKISYADSVKNPRKEEGVVPSFISLDDKYPLYGDQDNEELDSDSEMSFSGALNLDSSFGDESKKSKLTWGQRCASPTEGRSSSRILQLHQKLSSPSRKRSTTEFKRIQEEKHARAQELRDKILEEKAQKMRSVSRKVQEANKRQQMQQKSKQALIEKKLERAEQLRESHLQQIVSKAHDEYTKGHEIQFINSMEAENKKKAVEQRHADHEARLNDLKKSRYRRKEEQLAKNEAAEERRKAIEEERLAKLQAMEVKRKEQELKFEQSKIEAAAAREASAREKAKRLEALNAASACDAERMKAKILKKELEATDRFDQQLKQKREKAASKHLSSEEIKCEAFEKMKYCTVCRVDIPSRSYELSHLKGKKHKQALSLLQLDDPENMICIQQKDSLDEMLFEERPENLSDFKHGIVDSCEEKKLKKKLKKIQQKIHAESEIFHEEYMQPLRSASGMKIRDDVNKRLKRCVREVSRLGELIAGRKNLPKNLELLEKVLVDCSKLVDDELKDCELSYLFSTKLFSTVLDIYSECTGMDQTSYKTLLALAGFICSVTDRTEVGCKIVVGTGKALCLLDSFSALIMHGDLHKSIADLSMKNLTLLKLCTTLQRITQNVLSKKWELPEKMTVNKQDLVKYILHSKIVEKLSIRHLEVNADYCESASTKDFVFRSIGLLFALTHCSTFSSDGRNSCLSTNASSIDPSLGASNEWVTELLASSLKETEFCSVVTLLNRLMPKLSSKELSVRKTAFTIALLALNFLNAVNTLSPEIFQYVLGLSGISSQLMNVFETILRESSSVLSAEGGQLGVYLETLREALYCIGKFTVNNSCNQSTLSHCHDGAIIKEVCGLPFEYFRDPKMKDVLFPTLLCICFREQEILECIQKEMSVKCLISYLEDNISRSKSTSECNLVFPLSRRFPEPFWEDCVEFLKGKENGGGF
eukprot:Nk52_evm2s2340 gene=Nk52_evmTU2s2340